MMMIQGLCFQVYYVQGLQEPRARMADANCQTHGKKQREDQDAGQGLSRTDREIDRISDILLHFIGYFYLFFDGAGRRGP